MDTMNTKVVNLLIDILGKNSNNNENKGNIANKGLWTDYLGKYVIIRTYNEGLNCGFLEEADETGCILSEARRIWKPIPKDITLSWYEGIAVSGLHPEKGIISGIVEKKIIIERYSITLTTPEAQKNLQKFKTNETTY